MRIRRGAALLAVVLLFAGCRLESDPGQEPTAPSGPGGSQATPTFTPPTDFPTEDGETGDPDPTDSPDPLEDVEVRVALRDFVFDPDDITVSRNGTVGFLNEGGVLHNVTVKGQPIDVDVAPGEHYILDASTFASPGNFGVSCKYHASADLGSGMVASLDVEQ